MEITVLLFGFLLTVFCTTSFGSDYAKIEGGFGQKLGEKFDLKSVPADAKLYDQDGQIVQLPPSFFSPGKNIILYHRSQSKGFTVFLFLPLQKLI
jgi:hypothetical protein